MTQTVRDEVLHALAQAGNPLTFDELLAACHTVTENKQLSNALFQLKKAEQVVSPKRGLYMLPRGGYEQTAAPKSPPTPAAAAAAEPQSHDTVEQILQQLVDDTQGALDEYLVSIADPAILKPLQAARDQAREAVRAHREKLNGRV